jgi:flagellar biosynthetic protein FlhB
MAENADGQERTEEATPKRREEARKKGDVARSRDLNTAALLMAASSGLLALGGGAGEGLQATMRHFLSLDRDLLFDPGAVPGLVTQAIIQMIKILAPFLALAVIAACVAPLLLGGWVFSTEAFHFKFDRLNPLQGIKRVIGLKGLAEMGKTLVKVLVIAAVAVMVARTKMPAVLGLGHGSPQGDLAAAFDVMGWSFLWFCAATILLGALDAPLQLWEHSKRLRMTREEIRQELKDSEGKPEVRARIRRLQQEMANRRMMQEVPKADVIVTNPTHYAVALRYNQGSMAAPRVVAKGVDEIAARIRELGGEHRIPLLSMPPLARAIYHSTQLNHEIPAGLYVAVAQVLAYVYQLRSRPVHGSPPPPPKDVPIPDEFRREP